LKIGRLSQNVSRNVSHNEDIQLSRCNARLTLKPQGQHLFLTYYRLTTVGNELCQLIQAKNDDNKAINVINIMLSKDVVING
jgi:hypothetical protein